MTINYAERAAALLTSLPEWPGGDDLPTIMAAQAFATMALADTLAEKSEPPEGAAAQSVADWRADGVLTAIQWLETNGYATAARSLRRNIDDVLAQP